MLVGDAEWYVTSRLAQIRQYWKKLEGIQPRKDEIYTIHKCVKMSSVAR